LVSRLATAADSGETGLTMAKSNRSWVTAAPAGLRPRPLVLLKTSLRLLALPALAAVLVVGAGTRVPADGPDRAALDARVERFLAERQGQWRDMNVPAVDGQLLHDLIVKHNYTKALEIGTSTGHSGIWIAWALSKTGGRLITIEIDERRYREALANFEAAGLSAFIDARLGNAHELVPRLEGPFDFVFSDADKDWYRNYFEAVLPKLEVGGCYTTHNVTEGRGWRDRASAEYLAFLRSVPGVETTVDMRGAGMAISYKQK
jgi:caffeoyl-CoA O-methyltransferase